jgi:hypothetical protein
MGSTEPQRRGNENLLECLIPQRLFRFTLLRPSDSFYILFNDSVIDRDLDVGISSRLRRPKNKATYSGTGRRSLSRKWHRSCPRSESPVGLCSRHRFLHIPEFIQHHLISLLSSGLIRVSIVVTYIHYIVSLFLLIHPHPP